MNWIRANSDKVLLALLLPILLFVGFRRLDYAGDGMRHLDHILQSNYPTLGEPRWILFPLLLFVVVKPFAIVGIIHSAAQAAKVFCLFNVVCGFVYLVCLRRWLSELPALRRTAVLLLAGGSYVFLTLATDTIEPTPAVLIAVAGLTFGRYHAGLSESARVTIAAGSLALASVIYQGMLFGFFFLPAIFSISLLAIRQNFLRIVGLALAVPLFTIVLLCFGGETPGNAARRFVQGEGNNASSRQYSKPSAKNLAGVIIVGPTYAFASIPELRGLTGSLRMLRHWATAFEGIRGATAWCCMAVATIGSLVLLIFKKQFALLLAFAGMMTLPAIRMSQYSYMKFYVLLPFLVVLVVPRLGVRFVYPAFLGALLLLSNLGQIWSQRAQSETLRLQVARELYPQVPQAACFLTNGWGPPVPDWRGDSVAWLHILNAGDSASQEQVGKANSQLLRDRLRKLFCACPAVMTDAFILPNLTSLQEELSYFRIADIPLPKLVVPSTSSAEVFRSSKFVVYRFSPGDQRRACEALE
jgi:hypothetical protein